MATVTINIESSIGAMCLNLHILSSQSHRLRGLLTAGSEGGHVFVLLRDKRRG